MTPRLLALVLILFLAAGCADEPPAELDLAPYQNRVCDLGRLNARLSHFLSSGPAAWCRSGWCCAGAIGSGSEWGIHCTGCTECPIHCRSTSPQVHHQPHVARGAGAGHQGGFVPGAGGAAGDEDTEHTNRFGPVHGHEEFWDGGLPLVAPQVLGGPEEEQ